MIPRVSARGHSFKGIGMYLLHDKGGASTKERVKWTETINLPNNDADRAFRWMAYTSSNADRLKQENGIANTGRKATGGSVFSFSLAWHPEEEPKKKSMLDSAFETLDVLGLKDHEAVVVAHNDTDHPHIHVVANLVNPNNGKTAVMSYDQIKLSKWAQAKEQENGKVYCQNRADNWEKRESQAKKDRELALVKHREEKLKRAKLINDLYTQSDNGNSFKAALEDHGLTLAQGHRRALVLVNADGEVYSLARQLKKQRAKDIRERLQDLGEIPIGKELSEERKYFDRDKYEAEQQDKIDQAGIDHDIEQANTQGASDARKIKNPDKPKAKDLTEKGDDRIEPKGAKNEGKVVQYIKTQDKPSIEISKDSIENKIDRNRGFLQSLDKHRAWSADAELQRLKLNEELGTFYGRGDTEKRIDELRNKLKEKRLTDPITKRRQKLQDELSGLRKSLEDIDRRVGEQKDALEIKLAESEPPKPSHDQDNLAPEHIPNVVDLDAEKQKRIEELKAKYDQSVKMDKDTSKNNDRKKDRGGFEL